MTSGAASAMLLPRRAMAAGRLAAQHARRRPAAAPAPAPSPGPRRSASRRRRGPCGALSRLRSSSAFRSTTVLATDRLSPNTRPAPRLQPQSHAQADAEQRGEHDLADRAGHREPRTASRSDAEKCRPTPNISRMTPISASWPTGRASATKPGVNGPITMPATQVADQRRQAQPVGEIAEARTPARSRRRRWRSARLLDATGVLGFAVH